MDGSVGHLFATLQSSPGSPSTLLVLDADGATLPGELGLGQRPSTVAVDAQTHRAFVLGQHMAGVSHTLDHSHYLTDEFGYPLPS